MAKLLISKLLMNVKTTHEKKEQKIKKNQMCFKIMVTFVLNVVF